MTKQLLDHNRIVMARLELNLSQRDVAFEVGIHPSRCSGSNKVAATQLFLSEPSTASPLP